MKGSDTKKRTLLMWLEKILFSCPNAKLFRFKLYSVTDKKTSHLERGTGHGARDKYGGHQKRSYLDGGEGGRRHKRSSFGVTQCIF